MLVTPSVNYFVELTILFVRIIRKSFVLLGLFFFFFGFRIVVFGRNL